MLLSQVYSKWQMCVLTLAVYSRCTPAPPFCLLSSDGEAEARGFGAEVEAARIAAEVSNKVEARRMPEGGEVHEEGLYFI